MDTEPLKLKIDSKPAQADLAGLAKALDSAGAAVERMQGKFASGLAGTDVALSKSMKSIEKFAQVASLLSKVKVSGDPSAQIRAFATALTSLSRAKTIDPAQINNIKTLTRTLAEIKVPTGAARLTEFLAAVGTARGPSETTVLRIKDLLKAIANYQPGAATRNVSGLATFFTTISAIRAPSEATIGRLQKLFRVLAEAKAIPGASKIAADLDHVAQAAARAGAAFGALPRNMNGFTPAAERASRAANTLHNEVARAPTHSANAVRGYLSIGNSLEGLTSRFKLSYQAGTVFSALFSAFTVGQFIKGIYDTGIEIQKLGKALLFATGSFDGAHVAMQRFFAVSEDLGLNIDKTSEQFGKFAISSKASGLDFDQTLSIFRSVAQTLQIVGASTEQAGLAFYGLNEMMQKGNVLSKEFNRQIGAQIPGNAVIGARALSDLTGKYHSTADFFKEMSKGNIQSATFVPAWAKALQETFGDLKPLLDARPDVQLNRLIDAFVLFKKAIGDGGFMSAIGNEFKRLKDLLMEGEGPTAHLKKGVQELANELGKNFAQMVHLAGDGLAFAFQHIPELIMALKALAALKVGEAFLEWGGKANMFAKTLVTNVIPSVDKTIVITKKVVPAAAGAVAAEAASGLGFLGAGTRVRSGPIRTVTATESRLSRFGNAFSAVLGGLGASAAEPHIAPTLNRASDYRAAYSTVTAEGAAGMAAESRSNWINAYRAKARVGANYFEGAGGSGAAKAEQEAAAAMKIAGTEATAAKGLLGSFGQGIKNFGGMLPGIGALALGAGVALLAFSDSITEITTKAGNSVKVGDLAGSSFDRMAGGVVNWVKKIAGGNDEIDASGVAWGRVVAVVMTGIQVLVGGLFSLADMIGKVVGTYLSALTSGIITLGVVINDVLHGNFKGAKEALDSGKADLQTQWQSMLKGLGDDLKAFDIKGTYAGIVAGGQDKADARAKTVQTDVIGQKQQDDLQTSLQERQAAMEAQTAAGELIALNNRAALGSLNTPTMDSAIAALAASATLAAGSADKQATAAATMAAAATTSAAAAASTASTLKGVPQAPAAIAAAISNASRVTGVDKNLLTAIAYRESSFNPSAHAKTSSARGLFQFTAGPKGTGVQYGVNDQNWQDPQVQAVAAAQYARHNATVMQEQIGRAPTPGEIYAAHFSGAQGAVDLINAVKKDPNQSYATLFPKAAAANPFSRKLTVQQMYTNLTSTAKGGAIGAAGATGITAPMQGISELEGESLTEKADNVYKRFASLIGQTNPGEAAVSKLTETAATIQKLADDNNKLIAAGVHSTITPEDIAKLQRLNARLTQERDDALNPIAKENRLGAAANDITAMRLKGMADEADWQEKLNGLREQGYDITDKTILASHDDFIAQKDQNELLAAQVSLLNARNAAQVAGIARGGTSYDATVARLVDSSSKDGTYAQKLSDARDTGKLAVFQQQAGVEDQSRRADVIANYQGQIAEQTSSSRLNPSLKAYRDDFKSYLKDITGAQSDSLDIIASHATAAEIAMAKSYADAKQKLENPPGFQKWADGLEPLSKRLEDIKGQFAESLSGAITDSLTGGKVDWKSIFQQTQKSIVKAQVDTLLGGVIHAFGGKTAQKPEDIVKGAADQQAQATQNFEGATQTFGQSVDTFAQTIQQIATAGASLGGGGSPAGAALGGGSGGGSLGGRGGLNPINLGPPADLSGLQPIGGNLIPGYETPAAQANPVGLSSILSGGSITSGLNPGPLTNSADAMSNLTMAPAPDFSNIVPAGSGGGGNPIMSMIGSMLGGGKSGGGIGSSLLGLGLSAGLSALLNHKRKPISYLNPNGVIGESRAVNVQATQVAAHANPIGAILESVVGMAGSHGFGAPGGNLTSFLGGGGGAGAGGGGDIMSWLSRAMGGSGASGGGASGGGGSIMGFLKSILGGSFKEGGYATEPVGMQVMSAGAWNNAPHYNEGTANTSGMPVIVHPNEAIVPLTRGRKIPIDMGDTAGQSNVNVTSHITVIAPDPGGFRQSQGSIQRQQNRDMRRAAVRNLQAH